MKPIFLFLILSATFFTQVAADNSTSNKLIGLSIVKEASNPISYSNTIFNTNPISQLNLSRCDSEQDILYYLNTTSVGKQIVNSLFNYNLGRMNSATIRERLGKSSTEQLQQEDLQAAIWNNYVLVIKMDKKSQEKAMIGDTINFSPTGNWYLYQLQCTNEVYEQLRASYISPTDNQETQGEKRAQYESLSFPLKLIDYGENIHTDIVTRLKSRLKPISPEDIKNGKKIENLGKTSTALKIGLSPILILKR